MTSHEPHRAFAPDHDKPFVYPASYLALREAGRRAILEAVREAVGEASDLTLVRGVGNLGDQLIHAGTRQLLEGLPIREIGLDEVSRSHGHTALLTGSGAWCQPFHELMPATLGLLEGNFERVIVLPSSFDTSVPLVRLALEKSKALFFARERESYEQIARLCRAAIAPDGAFFFDFSPFVADGSGVLQTFRRDDEASGRAPITRANHDISLTARSLEEWIRTIAAHAVIQTDRAHVMIAAALLGKEVEFYPSSYHKLPGIADYALREFNVRRGRDERRMAPVRPLRKPAPRITGLRDRLEEQGRQSLPRLSPGLLEQRGEPRVTIVILSWNRREQTIACIESILKHVRIPFRLLVIDNDSDEHVRDALVARYNGHPSIELGLLDRNLGCGEARQLAASTTRTELIAFVDNDAEVFPGTIEHLVEALDRHPETVGVGARIVLPNGELQYCGGDYQIADGIITFEPMARGRAFDASLVDAPARWIGGTAFACRTSIFTSFPIDAGMSTYFEDTEWSYRVNQFRASAFRTASDAVVLHHQRSKERRGAKPAEIVRAFDFIVPIAHFYTVHGLVFEDLFAFVPELNEADGTRDLKSARLFLELVSSKGRDWVTTQWLHGELAPLFRGSSEPLQRELRTARETLDRINGSTWVRLGRLFLRTARRLHRAMRLTRIDGNE